jgi:hypothetical protein
MSDENPPPSPPPPVGGYPPPPPPAHRDPDWKRQAKNRERIAALVVLPALLVVIVAATVVNAASTDEPATTDSASTTSTESPTTTTDATTTQSGTSTELVVTPPPGVDQANADAFAAELADALVTVFGPDLDPDTIQASLFFMAAACQTMDSVAAVDPTAADDFVDQVVASRDVPSASPVVKAQFMGWSAAMFDAAADHLCPQHAVVLKGAAADLRQEQP